MLKNEPNNPTSAFSMDYKVQESLEKEKPGLPLVKMHKFGGPDDKFHFTIMARAKGCSLDSVFDTLTLEQKHDIHEDLQKCVQE